MKKTIPSGNAAYTGGANCVPTWPSAQKFTIPGGAAAQFTLGVIFYKTLAANDNYVSINGKFVPTIRLNISEDTGALAGYAAAYNRAYSQNAYGTCAGNTVIPTSPPVASTWNFIAGTPRELNGGRPF